MPIKRAELVDSSKPGFYHCISRCVRRAFLCGGKNGEFEHRRQWLEDRLQELVSIFAIDVVAFSIMSNHMHVLVWTDPHRVRDWSAVDVATRWLKLFPGSIQEDESQKQAAERIAKDRGRIKTLRKNLASLSWFNRCLKEPLARRANAEDECTGAFWEGRFKSYHAPDKEGALTCAVYVDLNPIRAGEAKTPEDSPHTSVKERAKVRQQFAGQRKRRSSRSKRHLRHDQDGLWLTPFGGDGAGSLGKGKVRTLFDFGVDKYLQLVDEAGRWVRSGKVGMIPAKLRPILERLEDGADAWLAKLGRQMRELYGTTVGQVASLEKEAARRGRKYVINPLAPDD